ncbi:hypothetical protein PSP20601_05059 [Pandoraea sputorum]|nr:hypothetical protein PSP20601_05059 [Pandoraea sputorum]
MWRLGRRGTLDACTATFERRGWRVSPSGGRESPEATAGVILLAPSTQRNFACVVQCGAPRERTAGTSGSCGAKYDNEPARLPFRLVAKLPAALCPSRIAIRPNQARLRAHLPARRPESACRRLRHLSRKSSMLTSVWLADRGRGHGQVVATRANNANADVNALDTGFRLLPVMGEPGVAAHGLLRTRQRGLVPLNGVEQRARDVAQSPLCAPPRTIRCATSACPPSRSWAGTGRINLRVGRWGRHEGVLAGWARPRRHDGRREGRREGRANRLESCKRLGSRADSDKPGTARRHPLPVSPLDSRALTTALAQAPARPPPKSGVRPKLRGPIMPTIDGIAVAATELSPPKPPRHRQVTCKFRAGSSPGIRQ